MERAVRPPATFHPGDEAALTFLEQHGYVVYSAVLNHDECFRARELTWDFLEVCGKLVRIFPD